MASTCTTRGGSPSGHSVLFPRFAVEVGGPEQGEPSDFCGEGALPEPGNGSPVMCPVLETGHWARAASGPVRPGGRSAVWSGCAHATVSSPFGSMRAGPAGAFLGAVRSGARLVFAHDGLALLSTCLPALGFRGLGSLARGSLRVRRCRVRARTTLRMRSHH